LIRSLVSKLVWLGRGVFVTLLRIVGLLVLISYLLFFLLAAAALYPLSIRRRKSIRK